MHVRSLREDLALRPFAGSGSCSEQGVIPTQTSFMPMFVTALPRLNWIHGVLPPGDARRTLRRDCEDASGCAAAAGFFLVDALPGSFGTETTGSPPGASSIVGSASISRSAAFKCSIISYDSSCDSTRRQAVRPNSSDPA